ncbi:hypothetical protein GGX14DRAFT_405460 [Mycena pura]|uniref:Uncharacterized protein n=1 Tax=Mycena pura TaxID=153505 RepID=A0AAD6UVL3_9AGAR|nr:hypothetical protein GGX14DRAFT_405460 [Mycena pura]
MAWAAFWLPLLDQGSLFGRLLVCSVTANRLPVCQRGGSESASRLSRPKKDLQVLHQPGSKGCKIQWKSHTAGSAVDQLDAQAAAAKVVDHMVHTPPVNKLASRIMCIASQPATIPRTRSSVYITSLPQKDGDSQPLNVQWHTMGDYADTITTVGTPDSYSTQIASNFYFEYWAQAESYSTQDELAHFLRKCLYHQTNKRN